MTAPVPRGRVTGDIPAPEAAVQDQPILLETLGRVGMIMLNRPKQMNALDDALMDALGVGLLAFDTDDGIGIIVITGVSKAYFEHC